MFCPRCKTEYRPGFTRCADCGCELVDTLPAGEKMEPGEKPDNVRLVPILETWDRADVLSLRMLLDPEGIEYFLQGDALTGLRGGDPVVLLVREDDQARVIELLRGVKLNYSNSAFNPKKKR